jgi:hypothetical protein
VPTGVIGRIFDRFPTAPDWLIARLGDADAFRRRVLSQGRARAENIQRKSASDVLVKLIHTTQNNPSPALRVMPRPLILDTIQDF